MSIRRQFTAERLRTGVDCTELEDAFLANLGSVGDRLIALHTTLAERFDGVPIVVVPYPVPIAPEHCGYSLFANAEHSFLHDFTVALNETVIAATERAGIQVIDTMPAALVQANQRLCDPNNEGGSTPARWA